jgi:hypothetical protein
VRGYGFHAFEDVAVLDANLQNVMADGNHRVELRVKAATLSQRLAKSQSESADSLFRLSGRPMTDR